MPSIVEGSILIMSKAGTGTAMFSMGENEALLFSLFSLFFVFFLFLLTNCCAEDLY